MYYFQTLPCQQWEGYSKGHQLPIRTQEEHCLPYPSLVVYSLPFLTDRTPFFIKVEGESAMWRIEQLTVLPHLKHGYSTAGLNRPQLCMGGGAMT